MQRRLIWILLLACFWIGTAACVRAQCGVRPYSDFHPGARRVVIDEVQIAGSLSLSEPEVSRVILDAKKLGFLYDDERWLEKVEETIKSPWRDDGFHAVSVKLSSATIASDESALHVSVHAQVDEGRRYKLKRIDFRQDADDSVPFSHSSVLTVDQPNAPVSDLVFPNQELRSKIPIVDGDWLSDAKIRAGIEALDVLYGSLGYNNVVVVPVTDVDEVASTITLTLAIDEGERFHIRSIDVSKLDRSIQSKLKLRIEPGDLMEANLFDTFLGDNRDLIAPGSRWCMWTSRSEIAALMDIHFEVVKFPQF